MNTWPDGHRHAMYQSDHEDWNAKHYPGTRQLCAHCEQPTGRCEDDSLYAENGDGPLCEDCWEAIQAKENANEATETPVSDTCARCGGPFVIPPVIHDTSETQRFEAHLCAACWARVQDEYREWSAHLSP